LAGSIANLVPNKPHTMIFIMVFWGEKSARIIRVNTVIVDHYGMLEKHYVPVFWIIHHYKFHVLSIKEFQQVSKMVNFNGR
jgi:hypothetical protein